MPPAGKFKQVSAGYCHTCGIRDDDSLECWGSNDDGESAPPMGSFSKVSAGKWSTCGLMRDGWLACWGYDYDGLNTPPTGTFTDLSSGDAHSCAVRTDGTIECWGTNLFGASTPPSGTFTSVTTGGYHSCGVRTDGSVACAGDNLYGQATPCYSRSSCGDGVVQSGEQCDDGDSAYNAGDSCRADCSYVPCGQPGNPTGTAPLARDALFVLRVAVGGATCDVRVCDVNNDVNNAGGITAADALLVLKKAVGQHVTLTCPA